MKTLLTMMLLVALAGCAAKQMSDDQIHQEAAIRYSAMLGPNQPEVSMIVVKIHSHGLLGDGLATATGAVSKAAQLRKALLVAKSGGELGFLIIGAGGALDLMTIRNAVASQDLGGMEIFYAGGTYALDQIRHAVEASGARFHLIAVQ